MGERKKRYGWLPDLPDKRDWVFRAAKPGAKLPRKVDLRAYCSRVEDQGDLGSCTAQALAGALEYLERLHRGEYEDRSRLFIYYNERVIIHTVREDSGAMLRDGIKSLVAKGACGEQLWPYEIAKFTIKPPANCYKDGAAHQITEYRRIQDLAGMRQCLAAGYPFVFGFMVYESFETGRVARTGVAPMPGKRERALGGHAVLAVGYDDAARRMLVRNSWGTKWGMAGYFTLPYAYLESRDLSDDFWSLRSAEDM